MKTLLELIDVYAAATYAAAMAWERAEGTAEDAECARLRAEIEHRVNEVRELLVSSLGDCLPVRILDGRP